MGNASPYNLNGRQTECHNEKTMQRFSFQFLGSFNISETRLALEMQDALTVSHVQGLSFRAIYHKFKSHYNKVTNINKGVTLNDNLHK